MRIVFMGTPAFAVPSLEALLDNGHEVIAAITQPDRPSGRGNKLTACPVKEAALARGVKVLQFERLRRQEGLDALRELAPELCVTAAFGQILSPKLLAVPKLGTVNVHASLLPAYRGAAPINWCIIGGETVTGVTTMMTDPGIDTGDMLLQRALPIAPDETAGAMTERLAELGAQLLVETLRRMAAGDCPRTPQDHAAATHQPMLEKAHGRIDWAKSAPEIANLVRGVNPWPGAYTPLADGSVLKIWRARAVEGEGIPGQVLASEGKLIIACGKGALNVLELQAPGAKRMDAAAYLRGRKVQILEREPS
jgi:methionyl-tRNA formyltransferase